MPLSTEQVMVNAQIVLRTFTVATPLLLGGCMMLGSGGMAHGSHGGGHAQAAMMGQTLIKETVVEGMRLTAEFPPHAIGDDLAYRVTLRRAGDSAAVANASVAMFIGREDQMDHVTRVAPSVLGDGAYVFRPIVETESAYRVVIRVERAEGVAPRSAVELEQVVRLGARMGMAAPQPDAIATSWWTPAAILGAGAMAIMMLLVMR